MSDINLLESLKGTDDVINIELCEYSYSCGDGCCFNYGTITKVNGIPLPLHNQDAPTIVEQILSHMGYKVRVSSIEEHD